MSADNWAVCPKCNAARGDHLRALDVDLANAYGKVPVEEFDRLRAERDAEVARQPEPTFREDYEFWGAEDGDLNISYSGGCSVCGLRHSFKHSEPIYSPAQPTQPGTTP